jgi:hypothetical protein
MTEVADKGMVLSLITGAIAIVFCYLQIRGDIRPGSPALLEAWEKIDPASLGGPQRLPEGAERSELSAGQRTWSKVIAVITPLAFLAVVADMIMPMLVPGFKAPQGAGAAAIVGGVAAALMAVAAVIGDGRGAFRATAAHFTEGLVFAFRSMSQVLPIAGFFFIGVPGLAGAILGIADGGKAPSLLFELVQGAGQMIPQNRFLVSFGVLVCGMLGGIDGSGFAGLPLVGSMAGALGRAVGLDVSTLAAIGQMGSVWTGKTLTAWSALAAVAAFARVPVFEVVRRLFVPVTTGLIGATICANLIW